MGGSHLPAVWWLSSRSAGSSKYLKVAACAKHFGPQRAEILRHEFNGRRAQDLRETYLPAFRCRYRGEGRVGHGAYSRVNGEPACASPTPAEDPGEEWV